MRIVITGAAGNIGTVLIEELEQSHELVLIDRRKLAIRHSIVADLSIPSSDKQPDGSNWDRALENSDAVIHLTCDPESIVWEKMLRDNMQTTWNVLDAAANHNVPRVVFASSNWAVKAVEEHLAPSCYLPDGPKIDSDAPPYSVSSYGLTKAFGELTGRMFVEQQKLRSFVAIRIGYFNAVPLDDPIVRARWIGIDDMRSLVRRCVETEFHGFHVVYGVSAQNTAPYDLSHTRALLDWQPKQIP